MNEMHYQRIDKGQPRQKYPDIPPVSNLAKNPLKDLPAGRRDEIATNVIARYLHGEQVAAMASEFDTSDVTLYALLLRDHEEEWKDAQTARALARLERENQRLEEAPDPLSLARARELVRSAQWELERLLNRIFGQKHEVTHIQADLGERLRRARERVIEGEVVAHNGVMSNSASSGINELQVVDKSVQPVDKHSASSPEGPIESKKPGPGG